MVRDPKAFLLDEPLSNLDPGLRARARLEVRHLHRTLGATILYVTHDQEEAMTLGSRVAVMREGRIEQVASPLELYERPATLFVARFVGSPEINVLDPPADGMTAPVDALAAVRPHDVVIGAGGPLRARVDAVEPRGPDAIVHLRADGGRALVAIVPAGAAGYPDPGSEVRLSWRPERVHYFDRATGARRQDV
jgi:ABC-type sugar transport system ATPase subunit